MNHSNVNKGNLFDGFWLIKILLVCVVFVCVREKEREKEKPSISSKTHKMLAIAVSG